MEGPWRKVHRRSMEGPREGKVVGRVPLPVTAEGVRGVALAHARHLLVTGRLRLRRRERLVGRERGGGGGMLGVHAQPGRDGEAREAVREAFEVAVVVEGAVGVLGHLSFVGEVGWSVACNGPSLSSLKARSA